jgi:hypothetical protein
LAFLALLTVASNGFAQAPPAASAAFDACVAKVESTLAQEHGSPEEFLAPVDLAKVRSGEPVIEKVAAADAEIPGAMLHDWRGSAFAPGATAADFEKLMRDFNSYPHVYDPQVVISAILTHHENRYTVRMRVRQKHVITVVLDATYDVTFGRLDARHGYSTSRSTQISEIEAAGTKEERALPPGKEHGFLWRLNTYWSYEERDGGLYLQIESVSLTRAIPVGIAWAVKPFVESVPRESLEFTLQRTCDALKHETAKGAGR